MAQYIARFVRRRAVATRPLVPPRDGPLAHLMRTREAHTVPLELRHGKPGLLMQRGPMADKRLLGDPETTLVAKTTHEYPELCRSEGRFGDF